MDGFKKMDEKFVDRVLSPAYRSYSIPRMERTRLLMFLLLVVVGLSAAYNYFVHHRSAPYLWWLGFYFFALVETDYKIKLFKVFDKLELSKAGYESNIGSDELIKKYSHESKRWKYFAIGIAVTGIITGVAYRLTAQ